MKIFALLLALSSSLSWLHAAATPVAPAGVTAPSKAESVPVAPPVPQKKDAKAVVKEKEPVIPGMTLTRPDGNLLGFEVLGGQIKVSFYNKKKKPMAVNVDRGLARWPNPRGNGQLTTPLNPSTSALVGAKPALPPYNYNILINLLVGEGEGAKTVESYVVNYRG